MKIGSYIIISILAFTSLFSCNGNEPKEQVISMEDLMGEFGDEVLIEGDSTLSQDSIAVTGPLGSFLRTELETFDTSNSEKFHMLDRFSFSIREKVNFKAKEEVPYGENTMVTPRANLFYYTFSDTLKTQNAFYNWLDCFGSDCAMVKLEEDVEAIKMPPACVLIYDTLIIAVNYRCEDINYDWRGFEKNLKNSFEQKPLFELKVDCGGPLKWK